MNKKAQIGSTITWILATLLIIGIMAFYLLGVSFSFLDREESREIVLISENQRLSKFNSLIFEMDSFLGINENIFSDWSDGGKVLTESDRVEGNFVEEDYLYYSNVFEIVKLYLDDKDVAYASFCVQSNDKNIFISKLDGEVNWRILPNRCSYQGEKFLFVSSEGNLVEVNYADSEFF